MSKKNKLVHFLVLLKNCTKDKINKNANTADTIQKCCSIKQNL